MDVLKQAAERADIKTTKVVNWDEIKILPQKDGKQCFSYAGYDAVTMKMLGVHQYENAVAAMLAAELFLKNILQEKECAGTESFAACNPGRDRPDTVDGTHGACEQ